MTAPTDLMRETLVAGLYPHLVGKVIDMAALYTAVDAFLQASAFGQLVDVAVTADANVQAYITAAPVGSPPPPGADPEAYNFKREQIRAGNGYYDEQFPALP